MSSNDPNDSNAPNDRAGSAAGLARMLGGGHHGGGVFGGGHHGGGHF